MTTSGLERYYRTSEVASRLDVHPETIRRAAARGELRSIRVGIERRYSESALREWIALLEARAAGERSA